jgi:MFS family permease
VIYTPFFFWNSDKICVLSPTLSLQIFLTQGIGLGLAGGMMYVPSVAVLSLYFKKKRTLAMTFASAGSAAGAVVHPIMINNLLSSGLGFKTTTRISAGLITFALLIAWLLMRPKLPPPNKRPPIINSIRKLCKDWPYVAMTFG